ncbi:anti-sigma factor domain-containing protein [Gordonia sp. (in: high G+C Gram-positive bacteria)]|uniref:anti-sigma factor n=1 Tax=Gordonia sp. (in: high G+C Gram-positive bacteria) TaxID=84139 RepID=UPI003528BD98
MDDDTGLIADAPQLALDALDEMERARLLRQVAQASAEERASFDAEVVAVRETLARLSHSTATAPPQELRARLLDTVADLGLPPAPGGASQPVGRRPWRLAAAAAAAAVVLGAGGAVFGYAIANRDGPTSSSTAADVFAAPDVRTATGDVAGGRATVTYSPTVGEGILVMNQVPRPAPGTVYQMWLDGPGGPRLAGTMSETDVGPSTTAVLRDMGGATAITFTVGSAAEPTRRVGAPVASLPLS